MLITLSLLLSLATQASAQEAKLGKVDFPTSVKSEKAQAHFMRGLAALHSFWYEEALDEFREATRIEPDFMMGYWGEAMAHNHPLWSQQDTDPARKTLEKIKDSAALTPRERAYINAVRVLYGEGDKQSRDRAYAQAMERVYRDYPDDLEAASFYALSLLGTVRPGDKGFKRQMEAGAIALAVYEKNPNHPGAAHYIIHSFDDPEHAIIALPAARRYAQIAPEAHHARHMPAHIFLQLGMWPEAATSNQSAWDVSDAWVKRKKMPISARDYHSLHWLLYVYLQQGRYSSAEELLKVKRNDMAEAGKDAGVARYNEDMAAAYVVETEQWDLASKFFTGAETAAGSSGGGAHAGHTPGATGDSAGAMSPRGQGRVVMPIFVRGLAAAKLGKEGADQAIALLDKMRGEMKTRGQDYLASVTEIRSLEIGAAAAATKNDFENAIKMMKLATRLEEDMSPPSGPPVLVKPSHELFGEILLQAGRPKEAAEQFTIALERQPNRARALLGLARASARQGDAKTARETYAKFLEQWKQSDSQLLEAKEAQAYLRQENTR
jgi:tetratricopeptide (TPR) repeat protein